MMDEIEVGPEAQQAAMLAVLAAGDPSNEKAWKNRVQKHLPMFAALVRDGYGYWGKEAQKIIDSQVFVGTYTGMELEETSKRLIVHIASPRADGGTEEIRTERTDNPPGWVMQRRLEDLEPGTEIVAFKYIEAIDQNRKVRVLVHFSPLRSKKSVPTQPDHSRTRSSAGSPPEPGGRDEQGASRSPGVSSSLSAPPQGDQTLSAEALAVQQGMADMTARQKIAVKNRCVGEGIDDWADPGPEHIDRVLIIIKEAS